MGDGLNFGQGEIVREGPVRVYLGGPSADFDHLVLALSPSSFILLTVHFHPLERPLPSLGPSTLPTRPSPQVFVKRYII